MLPSNQIPVQKMSALGCGVPLDGGPLPRELELSCKFGINRTTIGDMVRALKRDSLIQIESGHGTVLNCGGVEKNLGGLLDFQIEDTAAGHLQRALVLPLSERPSACQEAAEFQLRRIGTLADASVAEISAKSAPFDCFQFRGNRTATVVRL